ncbi:transcriptional regulator [Microtetraspora sp. NBRC 13810]|uniref:helix-turn-helix domain-containing protein n=1 Tax=Microtetraspora sp. NBRC 13810 TaxID=3030990 RepID=UPI0024A51BB1|nr:AraC family transcriptional regulator [Microtetraspora sp. NBRC 13810]GLW09671.1 transcriptional regulator [Microtetraspora sp. NBRC 13810]
MKVVDPPRVWETQATALPRTRRDGPGAAVWVWSGGALYAGPSLRLGPHSGAVACLVVGVDGPFAVDRAATGRLAARTALVAPRVRHHVTAGGGRMVFLYLDPGSAADRACRTRFTAGDRGVLVGHRAEAAVVAGAAGLSAGSTSAEVVGWIAEAAGGGTASCADPRIGTAVRRLLDADEPVPAGVLAGQVGLSESRFLRLFREGTGTSYRRFRLWAQMQRAARALAAGGNLTRAAQDGYFASPSHLSSAFHALFGLPPSDLLAHDVTIRPLDSRTPAEDSGRSHQPATASSAPPPAISTQKYSQEG